MDGKREDMLEITNTLMGKYSEGERFMTREISEMLTDSEGKTL